MKLKNPILFYLVFVFCILSILDIITSYFILPGEGNPIYLLTGSIIFMIVFKLGLMITAVSIYRSDKYYPSHFMYYLLMIILLLANLLLVIAVIGNVIGILNPAIVEQSSQLTTTQKAKGYSAFIGLIYLLPLMLSLLAFKCYEWSLKYINFEK